MTVFWIYNPDEILDANKFKEVWPTDDNSYEENLNALTRLLLIVSIIGYLIYRNTNILYFGIMYIFMIVCLYVYYNNKTQELFTTEIPTDTTKYHESTVSNPLGNVMLTDIHNNPERGPARPSYTDEQDVIIKKNTKRMIKSLNPSIQNIDQKLFQDLGDEMEFDNSMRTFYPTPSTQVTNDQDAFLQYCYGDTMNSKKVVAY